MKGGVCSSPSMRISQMDRGKNPLLARCLLQDTYCFVNAKEVLCKHDSQLKGKSW